MSPTESALRHRFLLGCGLLVAIGGALRIAAAQGDLWLDEMWAVSSAVGVESALGVLTDLRTTANHPLLSLWFHALGERLDVLPYRAPSLLAGVATIALAAAIGARRSRLEGVIAALLVAGSHLLVHYGSEARGYALMVAFAFAGFLAARMYALRPTGRAGVWLALAFGLSAVLGMLAHPGYAGFALALGPWVPVALWRRGRRGGALAADLARLFALPVVFGLAYGWLFVWTLENPGGPADPGGVVAIEAAAFTLGAPGGPVWHGVAGVAAALLTGAALWRLARARDDLVLFYALAIVVAPAVLVVANDGPLYVRYFLQSAAFTLLLSAGLAAGAWQRGGPLRVAAGAILALVLAGNALQVAGLLRSGRGAYTEALRHMAATTAGDVVTVGSRVFVPTGALVRFHGLKVTEKEIHYVGGPRSGRIPEWWIDESYDRFEPRDEWMAYRGRRYRLDGVYRYHALSGSNWFLYHAIPDDEMGE